MDGFIFFICFYYQKEGRPVKEQAGGKAYCAGAA
jgi:hypothetical protein